MGDISARLWNRTYSSSDGVDDITPPTLVALAGIHDHDGHLRILEQHLFHTAVVPGFLPGRVAVVLPFREALGTLILRRAARTSTKRGSFMI